MKKLALIVLFVMLLSPIIRATEIEEIILADLNGTYTIGHVHDTILRATSFNLSRNPITIHSVRVRVTGESYPSYYYCDWYPMAAAWRLNFRVSFNDTISGGYLEAFIRTSRDINILPSEAFMIEEEFISYSGGTWDLLLNGAGEINFLVESQDHPYSAACCGYGDPSTAINEVVLIIEADFGVPTKEHTWGSIKALYSN